MNTIKVPKEQPGSQMDQMADNICSKLTLVDLAGSEKEDEDDWVMDKHRLEGSNINKSLLALGNCIKILSERKV